MSEAMTEPTTRPWLVEQDGDGKFLIVAPQEDGNLVITGVLANLTPSQDEANAALIVRAVNNLDPLMEALRDTREVIHLSYCSRPSNHGLPCWKECTKATAALLAAKEATG